MRTRAHIICACICIHVSLRLFTRKNANAVCYVRMRACLRADLIKTQNAFARKIFQHSNALWVHKLSGCTIYMPSTVAGSICGHIYIYMVWVTKKSPFSVNQRPCNGNFAFRFRARSILHISVFIFAAWAK